MLQNVRVQLEESLPGTGGGRNPNEQLLLKILFVIPICALLLCYYRSCVQVSSCRLIDSWCVKLLKTVQFNIRGFTEISTVMIWLCYHCRWTGACLIYVVMLEVFITDSRLVVGFLLILVPLRLLSLNQIGSYDLFWYKIIYIVSMKIETIEFFSLLN